MNDTEPANVSLTVDGPCYTGEKETYTYTIPAPVKPVNIPGSNNQTTSS